MSSHLCPPPCPQSIPPCSLWLRWQGTCPPALTLPGTLCRWQVMGKCTPKSGLSPQLLRPVSRPTQRQVRHQLPPRRHSTPSPHQPGIVLGSRGEEEPVTPISREQSAPQGCRAPRARWCLCLHPQPRTAGCSGGRFALPTFKSPSAPPCPFSLSSQAGRCSSSPSELSRVFPGARCCSVLGITHTEAPVERQRGAGAAVTASGARHGTRPSHGPACTQPRRRKKMDLFHLLPFHPRPTTISDFSPFSAAPSPSP